MKNIVSALAPLVIWTLCVGALLISYWNYSRYVEAKQDQEQSRRNLRIALHARDDAGIGDAEFKRIESSHYRPYLKRFRVSLLVCISFGIAGLALLLA